MASEPAVHRSPDIMNGMPVFYGTRVPVRNLIDYLRAGDTVDMFLDDFPSVRREQVIAFLETAEVAVAGPANEDFTG
jgi:uncharacterized protein (DUF433 family)